MNELIPTKNRPLTQAERRELILDLWLSLRVRHIWAKISPPPLTGPIILTGQQGYDLNGDGRNFFTDDGGND